MYSYLNDNKFLTLLDSTRVKEHYIKIQVLTFQDERVIKEIQGIATGGSITVNGSSAVRRTINLTMVAQENENDLTNVNNIISINKKIRIEKGIKNYLNQYVNYGDIIWFPLGTYVLTSANCSFSSTSAIINIQGKDKMCLLDGTCGGSLPSAVTFHEMQVELNNGEYEIKAVSIYDIIKECVHFYGGEMLQNIYINGIDKTAKQSMKYNGTTPIWFTDDYSSFIMEDNFQEVPDGFTHKYKYGQEIGYRETELTFPGELIGEAGNSVTSILDKIVQTLGNYEYFYDIEGHFIFQEKKNYLNHYYTPIEQLNDSYYIKAFSDTKYYHTFNNNENVISYSFSPKFENIKNDFVVWGSKTNEQGTTSNIKYHVAIDEKPSLELAKQYMWKYSRGDEKTSKIITNFKDLNFHNENIPKKPLSGSEWTFKNDIDEAELEESLKEKILNYLYNEDVKLYFKNKAYQPEVDHQFTIYLKVQKGYEIRYYQADIIKQVNVLDFKINKLTLLDYLTDSIETQEILLTISLPVYEIVQKVEEKDLLSQIYFVEAQLIAYIYQTGLGLYYGYNQFKSHLDDVYAKGLILERESLLEQLKTENSSLYESLLNTEELKEMFELTLGPALASDFLFFPKFSLTKANFELVKTKTYTQSFKGIHLTFSTANIKKDRYSELMGAYIAQNGQKGLDDIKFKAICEVRNYAWANENIYGQKNSFQQNQPAQTNDIIKILTNATEQAKILTTKVLYGGNQKQDWSWTHYTRGNVQNVINETYNGTLDNGNFDKGIVNLVNGADTLGYWVLDTGSGYYSYYVADGSLTIGETKKLQRAGTRYQDVLQIMRERYWWWLDEVGPGSNKSSSKYAGGDWIVNWVTNIVERNAQNAERLRSWWSYVTEFGNKDFYDKWWLTYANEEAEEEVEDESKKQNVLIGYDYHPIQKKIINSEDTYGYWSKDGSWITLLTLPYGTPLDLETFEYKIINKLKQNKFKDEHQYLRLFTTKNFIDNTGILEGIRDSINLESQLSCKAEPNIIKYTKNGITYTLNTEFDYEFEPMEYEGRILTPEDRKNIIIFFSQKFKENSLLLADDLEKAIIKILENNTDESVASGEYEFITKDSAILIRKYYNHLNKKQTIKQLWDDIVQYQYDNEIKNFEEIPSEFKLKIIVYSPKDVSDVLDYSSNLYFELIGKPCDEWREELYRRALIESINNSKYSYYDEELLAFWRDIFDTTNLEWEEEWYKTVLRGTRSYQDLIDYIKSFKLEHFYNKELIDTFEEWKILNVKDNFLIMPIPKDVAIIEEKIIEKEHERDERISLLDKTLAGYDYEKKKIMEEFEPIISKLKNDLIKAYSALEYFKNNYLKLDYQNLSEIELQNKIKELIDIAYNEFEYEYKYYYIKAISESQIEACNRWKGWNPAVENNPGELHYWLEFLDNEELVTQFSVSAIGRRNKTITQDNLSVLYRLEVPDLVLINNDEEQLLNIIKNYNKKGQKYCVLKSNEIDYFTSSTIGSTAFDLIRDMLYSHLIYNINVNITCIPIYYLEPNQLIRINDKNAKIDGDFVITQFTIPLTYNGTMTITTNQSQTRV